MASVFAWLDNDDEQQRKMNELIELFKDESTVDELGIGSLRDTIANALFPGTSVLQTRARYFFFTAWLVRDVARHGYPMEQALARLRADETKLITALLAGTDGIGVIGRQARGSLKRMPSSAYWAGVGRLRFRTWDLSIANHFRAAAAQSRLAVVDQDEESPSVDLGIEASLPAMPRDVLESANFDLQPAEAGYLKDRIAETCDGTLFKWLALNGSAAAVDYAWDHPQYHQFPAHIRSLLDHARRLHHLTFGAALLYNLMLAEKRGDTGLIHDFQEELTVWEQDELGDGGVIEDWDLGAMWSTLLRINPRIHPATRAFITEWFKYAAIGAVADNASAKDLIRSRELRLKGNRARILGGAPLDQWSEGSGLARLDYRWLVAWRHLKDIYAGIEEG